MSLPSSKSLARSVNSGVFTVLTCDWGGQHNGIHLPFGIRTLVLPTFLLFAGFPLCPHLPVNPSILTLAERAL